MIRARTYRSVVFSVRLWVLTEIRMLLERCGFELEAAFGDFAGAPVATTRSRLLLVARKAPG